MAFSLALRQVLDLLEWRQCSTCKILSHDSHNKGHETCPKCKVSSLIKVDQDEVFKFDIPLGTKMCIVGSVSLGESSDAEEIIRQMIDRYQPSLVISGGAEGIDLLAAGNPEHPDLRKRTGIAQEMDIEAEVFLPKYPNWRYGFRPRNWKMAKTCDVLIRIADWRSSTYGSGWTRDQAAAMGKPTKEFLL